MKNGKDLVQAIACAGVGYALGNINPAYLISTYHGYDVRQMGSGNAGGTNIMMLEGKLAGISVMAFDIGKATLSVKLCQKAFPRFKSSGETAGAACILGHMFPAAMGFRGGKGLACLGGTIIAFGFKDFAVSLGVAVSVLLTTRYLCFVPICTSAFYSLYHGIKSGNWQGAKILASVVPPIIIKHLGNIKRIFEGKEFRVDYLWDAVGELERTGLKEAAEETLSKIRSLKEAPNMSDPSEWDTPDLPDKTEDEKDDDKNH
ncbi:MAG: glycerol-3-phosphate acyltransferase [Oscillospiraceae bacterium]|nr:glycerol-3-phosphate acyltransferase [Oscillospiraceae bacterium]